MKKNIFKALIIALSLAMVIASANLVAFADTAYVGIDDGTSTSTAAGQTLITVTNTHYQQKTNNVIQNKVATPTAYHIIVPDATVRTGWQFADAAVYAAFKDAYDSNASDGTGDELYQAIMDLVIADYEERDNGAASDGANNASAKFKAALETLKNYSAGEIELTEDASNECFVYNPSGTGVYEAGKGYTTDLAGVYLVRVTDDTGTRVYNPMAAYVSFGYSDSTGMVDKLTAATLVAKSTDKTVDKTIEDTDESISVGDTANYTLKGTYPYFAAEYSPNAVYFLGDSSEQLKDYSVPVVKIAGNQLTSGTDYTIFYRHGYGASATWDTTQTNATGFIVYLLDGADTDATPDGKANGYVAPVATAVPANADLPAYIPADTTGLTPEQIAAIPNGTCVSGETVEITYSAVVNTLIQGEVINTGYVVTSPDNGVSQWTNKSKVITDTYETFIQKLSDDGTPIALTGAHFAGTATDNGTGSAHDAYFRIIEEGVYEYYLGTPASGDIIENNWTADSLGGSYAGNKYTKDLRVASANGTEAIKGQVILKGLDADTEYTFIETVAPAGYSLNDTFTFTPAATESTTTVQKAGTLTDSETAGDVLWTVTTTTVTSASNGASYTAEATKVVSDVTVYGANCVDTKLSALPSTGGIGTYIFTFVGVAVMAAAVVFFLGHKKAEV